MKLKNKRHQYTKTAAPTRTGQGDLEYDQMKLKEYIDPFTGEPVPFLRLTY